MSGRELLHGWGGTGASAARRARPDDVSALRDAVVSAPERGLIVRGAGRSYGDPAQNAGGTVLDLTAWTDIVDLDLESPSVTVRAGCTLDRLLRALLPFGLWIPVLPGTRQVTVGGAVAADVHGKNHHVHGSLGSHLRSLELMVASGDVLRLEPEGPDADVFWATVGGMGLTGVILQATISLQRVETSRFVVDTERTPDLPSLLGRLTEGDRHHPYSVAWFDTVPRRGVIGRAVVTEGRSATLSDLEHAGEPASDALSFDSGQLARVPIRPAPSLVTPLTARVFNSLWFHKAPSRRDGELQSITQFFHPLDVVGDWNRLYGRRGFCQYQFVVPFAAEGAFSEAVGRIARSGHVSSLNVLKRFGAGNDAPLSFPMAGWTLAVDLPVRAGLPELLDDLDRLVLSAGGRLYLAKDSRTRPDTLAAMYPRLDDFRRVRDRVDPDRRFVSDLSRRLDL